MSSNKKLSGLFRKSITAWKRAKVKSSMARPTSGEFTTTVCGEKYQQLAVIKLKQPNGQLPVAVDNSQLQTMASESL